MNIDDSSFISSLPKVENQFSSDNPINILFINPNSSEGMTKDCLELISETLPPKTVVYGYTALVPAPYTIECHVDGVISAATILRDLVEKKAEQLFDGFLVGCFSKHVLIDSLREEFNKPIMGIMEAALYASRMLGASFGIISTDSTSQFRQREYVNSYSLEKFFVGARALDITVAELRFTSQEDLASKVDHLMSMFVAEAGPNCILLGCAGMSKIKKLTEKVAERLNVCVIDGVTVGICFLVDFARLGLSTSKQNVFKSSSQIRIDREQYFL